MATFFQYTQSIFGLNFYENYPKNRQISLCFFFSENVFLKVLYKSDSVEN
jgi:hypothetical protein